MSCEKITFYMDDYKLFAKYDDLTYKQTGRPSILGEDETVIGYYGFDLPKKQRSPEGINHIYLFFTENSHTAIGFKSVPKDVLSPDILPVKAWHGEILDLDKDLESRLRTDLEIV